VGRKGGFTGRERRGGRGDGGRGGGEGGIKTGPLTHIPT